MLDLYYDRPTSHINVIKLFRLECLIFQNQLQVLGILQIRLLNSSSSIPFSGPGLPDDY
jgi:hypothetical protein